MVLNDGGGPLAQPFRQWRREKRPFLRVSLEELVVGEGEVETRVSASFGLAEVDGSTVDWDELVMKCDKAVYAVKEIGGNLAVAH